MRWASFGPTPLARAIIALSPAGDGARQFVGRQDGEDRQRELAADALARWSAAGTHSRSAAEPKPNRVIAVLADLQFGKQHDLAADGAERDQRPAARGRDSRRRATSITALSAAGSARCR